MSKYKVGDLVTVHIDTKEKFYRVGVNSDMYQLSLRNYKARIVAVTGYNIYKIAGSSWNYDEKMLTKVIDRRLIKNE